MVVVFLTIDSKKIRETSVPSGHLNLLYYRDAVLSIYIFGKQI